MKISASIYSNHDKDLAGLIRELDAYHIDYFHLDSNDDPGVFDDIREIRKLSKTAIDLHLITDKPEQYWPLVKELKVELVTLQYETLKSKPIIPQGIHAQIGLSLITGTDVGVFEEYKDICTFILFMTTTPGESGGTFDRETFRRIRLFRSAYPDKKIHVDGGINAELSFILRNMGTNAAVIGSFLFRGDFIGSAVIKLRSDNIESHYRVKDFMLQNDEIPVLSIEGLDFPAILQSIEDYRMGFTMIATKEGKLEGIISNADMRRALIKNINNLNQIDVLAMINRNPAYVYDDETVSEILIYIKSLPFPVLFLPVVDREKRITGTIKFNNLIKGEQ